jgi:hypothetical protein
MLPYIYILYEIRGIQKLFDGKGKQNASRLHFFTVGWACIPSRLHARHSEISTVLHRGFLQQGIYSIALQN